MLRDNRINLIFEGSSEIMHLFMAREAVDKHLQVAGAMIDPKNDFRGKLAAMPGILAFYSKWYPPLWLKGVPNVFQYSDWGVLGKHLRFIDRASRKLARMSFHGMALYQAKMERKQGFLFRTVDIVIELFVMAATASRAKRMQDDDHPQAKRALDLADLHCRTARRKVKRLFNDLWANEDDRKNKLAADVLKGEYDWLRAGAIDLGWTEETFKTKAFSDVGRGMSPETTPEEPKQAAAS